MKCPNCNANNNHVVDTRPTTDDEVSRRRECLTCGFRWNTKEVFDGSKRKYRRKEKAKRIT